MRVAFILSSADHFGPFLVARDIISGLRSSVEQIDVYYLKDSSAPLKFDADHLAKIDFFKKTDFSQYDLVHSHGFLADAYVYYHRKSLKSKKVMTMHQNIFPDYSLGYNVVVGWLLEKIWCHFISKHDLIVCLSAHMQDYYVEKYKFKNITYVHNGINQLSLNRTESEKDLRSQLNIEKDHTVLGVSARLIYRKGVDILIDAVGLSYDKKLSIVIVGDGEELEKLKEQATQLGISERCFFVGYQRNVLPYYDLFDFYIMCSRSEAFGLCVIEAASLSIPVICADLPIYEELFGPADVIKFETENSIELSVAIDKAIKNKSELSEKIYRKFLEDYTAEMMAGKYLKLYTSVCNHPK